MSTNATAVSRQYIDGVVDKLTHTTECSWTRARHETPPGRGRHRAE